MHKDIKVLRFLLDENNQFKRVIENYNIDHAPFCTLVDGCVNEYHLKEWWTDRSIPVTRDGYKYIKENIPGEDSLSLLIKSHALSLDDQYWVKEAEEDINYDDISFFSNKFSNDVGDIIVGKSKNKNPSFYSPDSTSNGNLKKRWKIIKGQKYLLKAGSQPHQQEIINEIIASRVMFILGIDHVEYDLYIDDGKPYCRSLDFINYNEDFVSAYQLKQSYKKRNDISLYDHLLMVAENIGFSDYKTYLNKMLFIDFLLANQDRHLNNFGVIRDAKSLEFIRVAPIFDTGSCLGYNLSDDELKKLTKCDWMPFQSQKHKDQLSLIDDFSWLNIELLETVPLNIEMFLGRYVDFVSEGRRNAIVEFLVNRVNYIFRYLKIDKEIPMTGFETSIFERKLLKYTKDHGGELYDLDSLTKVFDVAYITIYRAVSNLTKKGLLIRRGARKNGYWVLP